jgi:flagellar basal body-associated protein FliL
MAARPPRVLISNSCNNNEKENENMAKKSTKFIALLLTVLMVITLLPMSVLADANSRQHIQQQHRKAKPLPMLFW